MTGPLQAPSNQSQDKGQAQTQTLGQPGSLFYDERLPNNIGLPPAYRTIRPPSNQVQDRIYHPQTGIVSLEPRVINFQPGELGKPENSNTRTLKSLLGTK
ncbi:hypothetical protein IFR05_003857 [Cadophora sp. M221]|nr:hypothetical protein IFR05_003857 [Cadophora sp. M221]